MLCRVIADHILMVLSSIISINANWCLFCKKWENYFHRFATFTARICFRNWYSHSLRYWSILLNVFLIIIKVVGYYGANDNDQEKQEKSKITSNIKYLELYQKIRTTICEDNENAQSVINSTISHNLKCLVKTKSADLFLSLLLCSALLERILFSQK